MCIFAALKGLNLTKTTAAAGPTKAYRSPPSKDSQQLQAKKKTGEEGGGGEIVNSHQDISSQVNGARQRRIAFPPAVEGGAPYAAPPFPKVLQDNKMLQRF